MTSHVDSHTPGFYMDSMNCNVFNMLSNTLHVYNDMVNYQQL